MMEAPDHRLRPCPFCGNPEIHLYTCDEYDRYFAERGRRLWTWTATCKNCDCRISCTGGFDEGDTCDDTEREAIEVWNTRIAPEDFRYKPLSAMEAHLQERVDTIRRKWAEERRKTLPENSPIEGEK